MVKSVKDGRGALEKFNDRENQKGNLLSGESALADQTADVAKGTGEAMKRVDALEERMAGNLENQLAGSASSADIGSAGWFTERNTDRTLVGGARAATGA